MASTLVLAETTMTEVEDPAIDDPLGRSLRLMAFLPPQLSHPEHPEGGSRD